MGPLGLEPKYHSFKTAPFYRLKFRRNFVRCFRYKFPVNLFPFPGKFSCTLSLLAVVNMDVRLPCPRRKFELNFTETDFTRTYTLFFSKQILRNPSPIPRSRFHIYLRTCLGASLHFILRMSPSFQGSLPHILGIKFTQVYTPFSV